MLQDLIMSWQTNKYVFKDCASYYCDLAKKQICVEDFARSYYDLANNNIFVQRLCKILL